MHPASGCKQLVGLINSWFWLVPAAVGGSFEISPGAASTQHAETTPGGGSGDDGWEDDDQWQKKNTGGEVTLAAPQIQVKAGLGRTGRLHELDDLEVDPQTDYRWL
eukprot:g26030.t1